MNENIFNFFMKSHDLYDKTIINHLMKRIMAVARSTSGIGTLGYGPGLSARLRMGASFCRYSDTSTCHSLVSTLIRASNGRGIVGTKSQTDIVELPFGLQLDKTDTKAKATITTYIPIFIIFCLFMYLDAAFSGDWSRIGVISKEQEQVLRSFFVISVSIHGILGLAAGAISLKRGEKSFAIRAIKTFVVGIVGFAEVWYLGEDDINGKQ